MKKINLEEIFRTNLGDNYPFFGLKLEDNVLLFNKCLLSMKEAVRQSLELASENAKLDISHEGTPKSEFSKNKKRFKVSINQNHIKQIDNIDIRIYKQSILETINQIE